MEINDIKITRVWGQLTPEMLSRLITYWKGLNALPSGVDPNSRAKQVAFIAETPEGEIVGVCTIYIQHVQQLFNNFYNYRSLVHPDFRRLGVATKLMLATQDMLKQAFDPTDIEAPKGIYVEVESPILQQYRSLGVWPYSRLVFIGRTPKGLDQRVLWFEGAKV